MEEVTSSKLYKWLPLILVVVVVGLSIGLFYTIKKMGDYKDMFDVTKAALSGEELKYNQARVLLEEKEFKIHVTDKKLAEEIGKSKVYEEMVVKWVSKINGGGVTKVINNYPVSEKAVDAVKENPTELTYYSKYNYSDFRIDITTDTKSKIIEYSLTQDMGVKIYKLGDYNYRAEIIEYNRLTHQPVTTFTSSSFDIRKVYKNPDKFNLGASISIGGDVALTQDFKFSPGGYLSFNFMSYGVSPLDSKFRFVSVAAGTNGAFVIPFSWNAGRSLPLFNDLYIDIPMVGIQYKKPITLILGIGISSTL
jgi:hypothetical protein